MSAKKVRVLKGFRDYLPAEMSARKDMIEKVTGVFRLFGFAPADTPALEYSEVLLGKYGADSEKLLYRFTDNGGRDICLRYDLTVPLARFMAEHRDLPRPFKRYQIAPVWRAEKPGRGRFREFVQCDADIVGTDSLVADAECVALDNACMSALGVKKFRVCLNERKILSGLALLAGVSAEDEPVFLRTLDKLESQGREQVQRLLADEVGLSAEAIASVFRLLETRGTNEEILAALAESFADVAPGLEGVEALRTVVRNSVELGVPPERVAVDVSIARGLDYYTGTVFETRLPDLPGFGSVMSGGRYDELIGSFTGEPTPAVGVSVGLDRLFAGLVELGLVEGTETETQVYVVALGEEAASAALRLAGALRAESISAEVAYDARARLRKQLKTVNARSIPIMAIIGEDELAAGEVTLKRMADRLQERVSAEAAAARVRELLAP